MNTALQKALQRTIDEQLPYAKGQIISDWYFCPKQKTLTQKPCWEQVWTTEELVEKQLVVTHQTITCCQPVILHIPFGYLDPRMVYPASQVFIYHKAHWVSLPVWAISNI